VRISALTERIQITFGELLLLYSYSVPDIIFYTLPLSFITALANVLVKLSQDNELIALYALGLPAKKVLNSMLLLGLLFSLLLLSISFLAMPLSKQFYKSFKQEKQAAAKLNIVPGTLGQKFGNYYMYVKEKNENVLHNIVIYNRTDQTNEQFFSSRTGHIQNKGNVVSLLLDEGYGYTYSENKLQQVQYKTLEIYHNLQTGGFKFEDIAAYWGQAKTDIKWLRRILFFTFISLIPILSVYLVASFTMINPRYQSNRSFLVIFTTTLLLYAIASSLEKWGTPLILCLIILLFAIVGQRLFTKRVSKYF
jgi:lipopolysaccharide export system permease protein